MVATRRSPLASPHPALREEGPMTAARIVLLDNDSFSLGAIHAPLADEGYRVLRCRPRDIADAHAMVKRAEADLVILDRWLGKRADGWALLGRLSVDGLTAHIPAIMAIGKAEVSPGATDFPRTMRCRMMAKPFDANELLAAIAAVLRPSLAQRDRGLQRHAIPSADPPAPLLADSPQVTATGEIL
ncbi:MAG: response regulator transcription factor [Thermomicrobiales bacterium]